MRYTRRRRRQEKAIHDIPLTPLIDTALTLLIIFMVASPMINNVIKVTLPKGQAQEDQGTPQELVVYVDDQNILYFDGKKTTTKDVIEQLNKALHGKTEQVVFVKADEGAKYGTIIELVDDIKVVGGIKHVALATEKRVA